MNTDVNHVKVIIRDLRDTSSKKTVTKLEMDKCERIVDRLDSFSTSCKECELGQSGLENHLLQLKAKGDQLESSDFKQHRQLVTKLVSHLQKEHKLLPDEYYLSIYMSLGLSIGVVFGLLLFDNLALGLPMGMSLGIAIGAGLDADAKKKGKTI